MEEGCEFTVGSQQLGSVLTGEINMHYWPFTFAEMCFRNVAAC